MNWDTGQGQQRSTLTGRSVLQLETQVSQQRLVLASRSLCQLVVVVVAFSWLAKILGECSTIHSPPEVVFFKVEISSRTLSPLFMPGSVHSGSAS